MTLGIATQCRIDDLVGTWVGDGKLFTAFEVSLAIQAQGVRARHRMLRDYIHQSINQAALATGQYTRTLMDVGAPEHAWVYHPVGVEASNYVPLDRSEFAPPQSPPRRSTRRARAVAPTVAPSQVPQGALRVDRRGRLCIPVHLLSRLGVGPGQRVAVQCDPATGQVLLTSVAIGAGDPRYSVESHGNVRITQGTLGEAGLDGMPWYRVDGIDGAIAVRRFT